VDISFTVFCLFVLLCVCTVKDVSAEDKASGVEFFTAVHRRPRQRIKKFCELFADKSDSARATPTSGNISRLCGHRIGMCGYPSVPFTDELVSHSTYGFSLVIVYSL